MGEDLPDGTKKITIAYTGGFVGLEELSARQKPRGVVPYNMLGNIFMAEDFFEQLNNWEEYWVGASSLVSWDDTYYMTYDGCCKLTAGPTSGNYARILRYLPYLGAKKYAFSCGIAHPSAVGGAFTFEITFSLPTYKIEAIVKVSPESGGVYLYQGAGTYIQIVTLAQTYWTVKLFNLLLFTVDLDSGYYDKLIWNDTEYDISAYTPVTTVAGQTFQGISVNLKNSAVGGVGCSCYVDNVCASRNVP